MLQLPGVSILSFYPDWMHCKSLGIDKILLGSTLWVLVHHVLPGDVENNLAQVWRDIEETYKVLNSENRYGHMRQTMFTTRSQPKLKGKAGEVKDLGPVMVQLWQKHMNPAFEIHRKILIVLKGCTHTHTHLELDCPPCIYLHIFRISGWSMPPNSPHPICATQIRYKSLAFL